ncbi:MAG TPA: hypothetical protein VGP62_18330 [Bryobacteraceae bacterium]|jgi:hypothetical protein|nr:hypothetical protein [Bryobacteraceae bacterium]
MTTNLFSPKCLFLLVLATAATSMAATKISYEDIPKHLGVFATYVEHRGITVTTADGKTHKGRRLQFTSDHLTIYRDKFQEDLPKSDVMRIEISQSGRFFHHVVENAQMVKEFAELSGDEFMDPIGEVILLPPALAYTAATTPFFLAADGIAFLIPPKIYDIVH